MKTTDEIQAFWNSRAGQGLRAGSQDIVLKKLEVEAIARHVKDGISVLDIGCGNGITAIELARRFSVNVHGIDNAEKMVKAAQDLAEKEVLRGTVEFRYGDIRALPQKLGQFHVVYTERTLINLPDLAAQQEALTQVASVVAPGGTYVMCESSSRGLQKINALRVQMDLPAIEKPWHNCYIDDDAIEHVKIPGLTLERVEDFSSTYYFLSRIVNASIAHQKGKEPTYEDPINMLALRIPSLFDGFGQTKLWIWRKTS